MAIFTGNPVEICSSRSLWIHDTGGFSGRFSYGGAIYEVGFEGEDLRNGAAVGKSDDDGATWTTFYQGGDPLFPPEQWTGFQDVVLDSAAGKLIFVAQESFVNGNLATFSFDLVGETFSAASYASGGVFNGTHPFVLAQRPNGDIRAFYYEPVGALKRLMCLPIVAGVFGSPIVVDAGTGTETLAIASAISDSSGNIHIAYTVDGATLAYIVLDASDTPGARQIIDIGGPYRDSDSPPHNAGLSNGLVWGGGILFMQAFASAGIARFYYGTPLAAPVWSTVALHSLTPGLTDYEAIAVDAGSVVKFLYLRHDSPVTQLEVMQVDWNGTTLGAPAVFWDIIANPPPGSDDVLPENMATDGITADLSAGVVGVAVTVVIDELNNYSAVYVSGGASGYRNRTRYETQ